ncbi:MAG: histidine kinase [Lachnospiraceae bacterium]|nr:histidine kinase [Lachnospiraceae bacterium]
MLEFIQEYFQSSYLTLMILVTLLVMMYANRNVKFQERGLIYLVSGLTFLASVFEFLEEWCDMYNKSYRILYFKAGAIYTIYPLIILIILYLTGDVKRKLLVAIPEIVNAIIVLVDISDTRIVYYYSVDHGYFGGPLNWLPMAVEVFYLLLLGVYSFRLLKVGKKGLGLCVVFMAACCLVSIAMTNEGIIETKMVPAVVALEIWVYYFYLSAIQYREAQETLNAERLELERSRNNLLMAQIRPHFIDTTLTVIRGLCYDDPEVAVSMIDHFSAYLCENVKQLNDMTLVPFEKEMESVDNYLYLVMHRFPDRIKVVKNFEITNFSVPPLAIQTIVENAVKHGIIAMGEGVGTIEIKTVEQGEDIIVSVKDDGKGFDLSAVSFDGVKHVGVKNVMDRFKSLLGGEVTVKSSVGAGTEVIMRIPERGQG